MSTSAEYPSLVPYLVVKGAAKAIEFYKAAFGATERFRLGTTGTEQVGHAELSILGQVIMLADEFPGMSTSPQTLNGTATTFVLMVPNADDAFARAVSAGAVAAMPPGDQFYGYRMGLVIDPFGHKWMLQHKIATVPVAEMQRRWDAMVQRCASPTP
jgi:PhnB protein